jgi:hypothetical protein
MYRLSLIIPCRGPATFVPRRPRTLGHRSFWRTFVYERSKQTAELESFRDLWHGGFFVADPTEKLAPFGLESMVGSYHVIYLACIRPWLTPRTHVLEIGPGRGALDTAVPWGKPGHLCRRALSRTERFLLLRWTQ